MYRIGILITCLSFGIVSVMLPQSLWVMSDFEVNDDGWKVVGDAQGISVIPDWEWDNDNGNGYVSAKDDVVGGHWYWNAPQKFLGEMGGAYGYTLTYELRQNPTDRQWIVAPNVVLRGRGVRIVYSTFVNPGRDWTAYEVKLEEGYWKLHHKDGDYAQDIIIRNILESLDSLLIRGEFRDGADVGDLDNVVLRFDPTDVEKQASSQTVRAYKLEQNYPNPFNPETMINYQLPISNYVELSIFNLIGQEVAVLISEIQPAGEYEVRWDARAFTSGVYYYRLQAGDYMETKKLILLR